MANLAKFPNNSNLILTTMARLQGISGGMSGKTGSFTYRQSRGQTIVSQYQPIVKNPNTAGQQAQRAKFKLMSQLAAVMSAGFGTMGINERPARQRPTTRNAFVSLNMPLVEVTTAADNSVSAKIPMEQIKLTSSERYLGVIDKDGLNIVVTTEDSAITHVQFVEVNYINNDVTRPTLINVELVSRSGSQFVYGPQSPSGNYTVLAFGLIPSSEATTAKLDNLHTPTNDAYTAAVVLNNLVSAGTLSETSTIGINDVIA